MDKDRGRNRGDGPLPQRLGRDARVTLADRPHARRQRGPLTADALSLEGSDPDEPVEEAPLHEMVSLLTRSLRSDQPPGSSGVVKLVLRSGAPAPMPDGRSGAPAIAAGPPELSRPIVTHRGAYPSEAPTAPLDVPVPPRIPTLSSLALDPDNPLAMSGEPGHSMLAVRHARSRRVGRVALAILLLAVSAGTSFYLFTQADSAEQAPTDELER